MHISVEIAAFGRDYARFSKIVAIGSNYVKVDLAQIKGVSDEIVAFGSGVACFR